MPSSRRGDFHGLIASDPSAACYRIRGPDASCGDDLTWVHDLLGIERLFDATHQVEAGAKLVDEELPRPTPCSPVHVPSMAIALMISRS